MSEIVTCGICNRSWDAEKDPAPAALCHWCHGRGYSTAPVNPPDCECATTDGVPCLPCQDVIPENLGDGVSESEYTVVLRFEADNQSAATTLIEAIRSIAPYMVDNVDIDVYGEVR